VLRSVKQICGLKISEKGQLNYKSEGNFSHIRKTPDDLWDLDDSNNNNLDKSHIIRKIRFPVTR